MLQAGTLKSKVTEYSNQTGSQPWVRCLARLRRGFGGVDGGAELRDPPPALAGRAPGASLWLVSVADGNHWMSTAQDMDAAAAAFFAKEAREIPTMYGAGSGAGF